MHRVDEDYPEDPRAIHVEIQLLEFATEMLSVPPKKRFLKAPSMLTAPSHRLSPGTRHKCPCHWVWDQVRSKAYFELSAKSVTTWYSGRPQGVVTTG